MTLCSLIDTTFREESAASILKIPEMDNKNVGDARQEGR
jgi:hypothetical protein